jgi:uncharacterized protein (TIGR02271 family)
MAMAQNATVVGVFSDHSDARRAVRALKDAGFTESDIGVASAGDHANGTVTTEGDTTDAGFTGEGALTGAVAGAGVGTLWGLGILAGVLPAIGPAIAGGTLAVLLSNAAAGAAAIGLAGGLIGLGIPKEEAEYYESEMKAGRTIVTVNAGSRRQEAMTLLKQYGGYDMSTRGELESTRCESAAVCDSAPVTSQKVSSSTGKTVQAREERLRVQKTPVETGEVTIRKEVHTEHKTIDVPVTREEIVIERRRGTAADIATSSMSPGQEIRIPVKEEQVHVRKETVVGEEVFVGKREVTGAEHIDESLRKEEIKVDTTGKVKVKEQRK